MSSSGSTPPASPIDALIAREIDGVRWHRCLRCDSWLALPAPAGPPARTRPAATRSSCRCAGGRCATRSCCGDRDQPRRALRRPRAARRRDPAVRRQPRRLARPLLPRRGRPAGRRGPGRAASRALGEIDKLFSLQSTRLHLFAVVTRLRRGRGRRGGRPVVPAALGRVPDLRSSPPRCCPSRSTSSSTGSRRSR